MDALSSVSLGGSYAGLQAAQEQMAQATAVVADPASAASVVALSAAAVALQSARVAFEANIQAIQIQNETLGSLIDTLA